MNYKKISVASVAVGMFAAGAAFAQNAEIATWSGFRKGAASFTFDDGAPSHVTDAGPTFKKYGYKATFNLVVNWNPNWSGFQGLADEGHEIASQAEVRHRYGRLPELQRTQRKRCSPELHRGPYLQR